MKFSHRLASRLIGLLVCCLALSGPSRGDGPVHALWELHGKRNTVYLLGSIHVLRASDYPLPKAISDAYANSKSLVMEINLGEVDIADVQAQMLQSALLPEGKTLAAILGNERYARAAALCTPLGINLADFDQFAPWFVAEAISQLQLLQQGFEPDAGVEMHFLGLAQADGKSLAGLETAHDQIALFEAMPMETQAAYLLSSLAEAHDLPREVNDMVAAWQRGDTAWFNGELTREFGQDSPLYQAVLIARNRLWVPKIEAMLNDDKNYLDNVGTGHLVGKGSVIDLLKRDGIAASQQ